MNSYQKLLKKPVLFMMLAILMQAAMLYLLLDGRYSFVTIYAKDISAWVNTVVTFSFDLVGRDSYWDIANRVIGIVYIIFALKILFGIITSLTKHAFSVGKHFKNTEIPVVSVRISLAGILHNMKSALYYLVSMNLISIIFLTPFDGSQTSGAETDAMMMYICWGALVLVALLETAYYSYVQGGRVISSFFKILGQYLIVSFVVFYTWLLTYKNVYVIYEEIKRLNSDFDLEWMYALLEIGSVVVLPLLLLNAVRKMLVISFTDVNNKPVKSSVSFYVIFALLFYVTATALTIYFDPAFRGDDNIETILNALRMLTLCIIPLAVALLSRLMQIRLIYPEKPDDTPEAIHTLD